MNSITMTRNAKFWGLRFSPEFMSDYKKTISVYNSILNHLRQLLVSGEIDKIDRFYIYHKGGSLLDDKTGLSYSTAAQYVADVLDPMGVFDGSREKCQSFKRMILYYCMERYLGYANRNDNKKIPTIVIKENKSLYYKESNFVTVDMENEKLIVKTLYGEHDVPFYRSLKAEHLKPKGKSKTTTTGGNFIINQKCFVAAVEFEKELIYEPESVLSFDLNKTRGDWMVFNNGEKIVPSPEIGKLFDEIREANKLLDKDKKKPVPERLINTKTRRKVRRDWQKKHEKLKNLIKTICVEICRQTIRDKSLLCIDSVKTGQSNGTFGQDHIIPELVTLCENSGIPFYVVPCKNTSRRCSECGYIHKANRVSTSEFECQECGHKCDAQMNGALNVAHQGNRLLKAGVPYGNWQRRSVDKLVEEYSQQQSSVVTSEAS